jgi:DNA polymerase III sliding clamp (beta) subunit (PCNA family)
MMSFHIAKSNIMPALAACVAVTDAKSPTPIGSCVILDASMGTLTIKATNMYQSIERTVPALAVTSPGTVMVSAADFAKRVDAFPDGEITIAETKGGIDIRQGKPKGFTLGKVEIPEQAPAVRVEPQGSEIDAKAFAALLGRMVPAMGTNEGHPGTFAVNIEGNGGKLTAMATGGHMGAIASLTFDGEIGVLIPAPAVTQLRKVLAKIDGSVRLFVTGNKLHIFATGLAYSTLISAGEFPPLRNIMPARAGRSLKANRQELLNEIAFVETVTLHLDRIHIRPGKSGVILHGASKEGETASRDFDGTCDIQSSISSKYLTKMLEFIGGGDVTLWQDKGVRDLNMPAGPMVAENADGDLFVVMPLGHDADDLSTDGIKD